MAAANPLERVLRLSESRRMKRLQEQADYVVSLEEQFSSLSDEELAGKTAEFKERLAAGETLEDVLFDAYAAVREAAWRALGLKAFAVQVLGGIVLHEGDIAEMKTGEGKTLAATMPLYLNALAGRGVHLVTANDYLATRDRDWMGPVFERLGMHAAAIRQDMPFEERKAAYEADITYGTNSEFGFDYLRDNMSPSLETQVQRGYFYAIVDEVDSILIDEARTPLIISGEPQTAAETYVAFARVAKGLTGHPSKTSDQKGAGAASGADFEYDEKHKTVSPFSGAIEKVERALRVENLYDPRNGQLVNHLLQALKAEALFKRDIDYVVQDGEVKIVDQFTGRIMEGRRWSEGLHQAIEAKEGVAIQEENVTVATVTIQNYFRVYEKLAGMTGTAKTEEKEFVEIYGLHVVPIPTNVPVARQDENDYIFRTKEGKFAAVADDIEERHQKGQPVLVGTVAVETSEYLSELLKRRGVKHNVLNAKEHAREAEIIEHAGEPGAVTIATNMAGRGVDIKISDPVREVGGLYVLGTERHESRRIDNQLRGRSGRQGDRGESRFYLSGEDNLVRLFAGDRIHNIMQRFKLPEDKPMEAPILSRQIEGAQKKVEEVNFSMRKEVLKYDDVMNTQRQVIYEQRQSVLEGADLSEDMEDAVAALIARIVDEHTDAEYPEEWDLDGLHRVLEALYDTEIQRAELTGLDQEGIRDDVVEDALDSLKRKRELVGDDSWQDVLRYLMLQTVDLRWREHLDAMEYLRQGIGLRGLAQKNPLVEYRHEGHLMFEELGANIRDEVARILLSMQINLEEAQELQEEMQAREALPVQAGPTPAVATPPKPAPVSAGPKIGRNQPCPCGSGKKYKNCHGSGTQAPPAGSLSAGV
jgi:preprotein translocase subunit SecA